MRKKSTQFWLALATFLGVVIGAGLFGLPYVGVQAGFLGLLVMFLMLAPIVAIIYLRFADIVIGTRQRDRIPGYVGRYLGKRWQPVSITVSFLGFMGSNLAYLIIGGSFLALLVGPALMERPALALVLFFLASLPFTLKGEKGIARIDLTLLILFGAIGLIFAFVGLSEFTPSHLSGFRADRLPLTYGIILFSLWGLPIVPEAADLVKHKRRDVTRIIWLSVLIATVFYLIFTFSVQGVTGPDTTPDALTGFVDATFRWLGPFAAIFGLIAIFTSYITQVITFSETLQFDAKLSRRASYAITLFGPVLLYFIGLRNFITVIGLTGAVLLGIEGTLVLLTAEAFYKRKKKSHVFQWTSGLLIILLLIGVGVELWSFFR